MATIPEPGRAAAHVLLDALSGWESGGGERLNAEVMNLALRRLDEVDGAVTTTADGLSLDLSNLVGGAVVSMHWLIERLALSRGIDRHAVITELREFLDA